MANDRSVLSILSLGVAAATLVMVVMILIGEHGSEITPRDELSKKLAGELADNNLYRASIDEYKKILDEPTTDDNTRANINYLIGKTYFEHLGDYENAAAYFIKARSLNPKANFYDEAGRMLVNSLEKMGRMIDARRELDKEVNLDSVYAANEGKTVVAKINDMPVYMDDIDEYVQMLPPQMQENYSTREDKIQAVKNYIGEELVYRAAVREGFDRNPEVLKTSDLLNRQVVVDKFVSQKVLGDVKIDQSDIRNFYTANKSKMFDDKPFDEVSQQVIQAYQQVKAQEAFKNYVSKLMQADNVQIYENKIK